jgi:transcription antitermination protein NusB
MNPMIDTNDNKTEAYLLHKKVPPRCVSRFAAVQVLFQSFYTESALAVVMEQFIEDRFEGEFYAIFQDDLYKIDLSFFKRLIETVEEHSAQIEAQLTPLLMQERSLETLELSTRAILMAGGAELCFLREEVPPPVVIDQYTLLAHSFLLKNGYALINGVLDRLSSHLMEGG